MKFLTIRFTRLALPAAVGAALLVLAGSASAAHKVGDEVGRWVGFGHQAGQMADGSRVVLDLSTSAATPGLVGTISGLPAVQDTLRVTGIVTEGGMLRLRFIGGGGTVGFCDGSVRVLRHYSKVGDPDVIGDLNYSLTLATGGVARGHLNMLHLYGGAAWADVQAVNLVGQGRGAFMQPNANTCDGSVMKVDEQRGSLISGLIGLLDQPYEMVGTIDRPGSLVMMCDGSVRNGDTVSLIGLLFTGGVDLASPQPSIVGQFGDGSVDRLLPAVQRIRGGTMSFAYAAGG